MEKILQEIEENLKEKFSQVYGEFQGGASDEELKDLKNLFSEDLPQELIELYKWHNGQDGYGSLNQKDNFTFLPIDEVVDGYDFLNDPMEEPSKPYEKSWIPLLYNGRGDYLMYESQGENQGKILTYLHDSSERKIKYESIQELLTKALESMK